MSNQNRRFERHTRRLAKLGIDSSILSIALFASYLLRHDWQPPMQALKQFVVIWPYVIALQMAFIVFTGVFDFSWRYTGLRECRRIAVALVPSSILLLTLRLLAPFIIPTFGRFAYLQVPIGIIATNFGLAIAGIVGIRAVRRTLAERYEIGQRATIKKTTRTVLVGAGQGGLLIAREIEQRPELAIEAVGFFDDDERKHGAIIHGLRVLGPIDRAEEFCERHNIEEALVTISNISGSSLREIVAKCDAAGLPTKIIPGLHEIVGGKARLSRMREVRIEDLLRRQPVALDMHAISQFIQGESILVTGAGGSIGSELCRQILRFAPRALYMVERSENALFEIDRELRQLGLKNLELIPEIADITDAPRVREVIERAAPGVIFHAAAHKHVPMMESNPAEAVKNNLGGTINLVEIAGECRVPSFVMISTDKAVNPTSIMGATKRSAELYIQSVRHSHPNTRYAAVRFGNVLGSNGSVVPIFQKQIEAGGPVTVTHPEMRRYFMTIPEASQLVLQAAVLSEDGEIFILDMGEPVRILDLAHDLIRLSGFELGVDIDIEFSGIRPGEKLFEELNADIAQLTTTKHPSIFVVPEASTHREAPSSQAMVEFAQRAQLLARQQLFQGLQGFVPEFMSTEVQKPRVLKDGTGNVIQLRSTSTS